MRYFVKVCEKVAETMIKAETFMNPAHGDTLLPAQKSWNNSGVGSMQPLMDTFYCRAGIFRVSENPAAWLLDREIPLCK